MERNHETMNKKKKVWGMVEGRRECREGEVVCVVSHVVCGEWGNGDVCQQRK